MRSLPSHGSKIIADREVVYVVDDYGDLRFAVDILLRSVGFETRLFASATDLLGSLTTRDAGCVILDVRLPGLSGLDCQLELIRRGLRIPIVFMTGHGDVQMCARAMKAGAVDFLIKPFRDQELLDAVRNAIDLDRQRRAVDACERDLEDRFECLSQRERDVMSLATHGLLNKQIAGVLGLSEVTIKLHRGQVMRKMEASSFAELVRMASGLGLSSLGKIPSEAWRLDSTRPGKPSSRSTLQSPRMRPQLYNELNRDITDRLQPL